MYKVYIYIVTGAAASLCRDLDYHMGSNGGDHCSECVVDSRMCETLRAFDHFKRALQVDVWPGLLILRPVGGRTMSRRLIGLPRNLILCVHIIPFVFLGLQTCSSARHRGGPLPELVFNSTFSIFFYLRVNPQAKCTCGLFCAVG